MTPSAPTTEQGSTTGFGGGTGLLSWSSLAGDALEHVPQLMWPQSVQAYRRMLNDAQCHGLWLGLTLPIRSFNWYLEPNGASSAVVQRIAEDYGLPVKGEPDKPRSRQSRRFSFVKHLEDALRSIVYGHYFFEQVGEIGDDMKWHLRKLAPRPPFTLSEIKAAKDGGLESIQQMVGPQSPPIPVDRLVGYVWDREGANWTGRSMFRSSYGPWLIKDRILRVGAINIERAGGVPYAEAPPGADAETIKALDRLAQNFKIGEGSGGALPHGAQLKLARAVGGGDTDGGAVGYINLMNEEMARSFLLMLIQLGQTQTGSRALGGEFTDFAALVQSAVADFICDVFNEHVIEDDVDWNEGEQEEFVPLLAYEAGATDPMAGFEEQLEQGEDPDAESGIRAQPGGEVATMLGRSSRKGASRGARRQRRAVAAAEPDSPVPLPDRPLRRQPYNHEVRAAVDYAAMDQSWQGARDALVAEYRNQQAAQIEELHDAIVEADGDLRILSELRAGTVGEAEIHAALADMADEGARQAMGEAERQGHKITKPDLDDITERLSVRASATADLLARSISETAGRRAIQITGGALTPAEVAEAVATHLKSLSDNYLAEQLGGAVTAAQNDGRKAAFRESPPEHLYASELLDTNTCASCAAIDGTEYQTLLDSEQDYPTGGFIDCHGGPRCRGTLVGVYDEAAPS